MESALTFAAFAAAWVLLQSWLLPKFGIPT
jgi:hypothetical protein